MVVKKLWGYIRRKRNRFIINVIVEMKNEQTENVEATVDVEVQCMSKGELTDSFMTKAKLRTFKATEPEL